MENQAMMISKVKNMYIMLLHAISKENISMVDHFLDDELTEKFKLTIEFYPNERDVILYINNIEFFRG